MTISRTPEVRYERVYDLSTYQQPDNCTGCRFMNDRAIVDMMCPVHGANGEPTVGPPDWPALVTVTVGA